MTANKRESVLERLVREISGSAKAKTASATAALTANREIKGLASGDYRRALRLCLSQGEVRRIVGQAKTRVWPNLNQAPVRLVSLDEFVRRWSVLGVDFKFASLSWKKGLSLLGFYLTKTDGSRVRPLIFVNTAHHPALVGLALDHEMGHHLTSRIFASAEETTHLLSLTGFEEHLTDPVELAADTLVSFGIFPAPIARTLFDCAKAGGAGKGLPDETFAKVLEYVANRYSFRFELIGRADQKLQALAAVVHYTKLRRALLDEYHR
jgi:hypothetical protein